MWGMVMELGLMMIGDRGSEADCKGGHVCVWICLLGLNAWMDVEMYGCLKVSWVCRKSHISTITCDRCMMVSCL